MKAARAGADLALTYLCALRGVVTLDSPAVKQTRAFFTPTVIRSFIWRRPAYVRDKRFVRGGQRSEELPRATITLRCAKHISLCSFTKKNR